ncbi:uncharacterized protein LOC143692254 [Agelaius phoeniceus]|uniref:uncharacterized protein LOC143692254 n=1 Tax=Agelaius phoeniceus TaxID=39638 RepID=UPI004054BEE0
MQRDKKKNGPYEKGEYGQIKVRPRNCKGYRYICSSESFEGVRIQILRPRTLGHRCGREGQLPLIGSLCPEVPGTAGSSVGTPSNVLQGATALLGGWPPAEPTFPRRLFPMASLGAARGAIPTPAAYYSSPTASAWDASRTRHPSPSLVPVSSIPEAHRLSSDSTPCLEGILKERPPERLFPAADGCLFWGGTGERDWSGEASPDVPANDGARRAAAERRPRDLHRSHNVATEQQSGITLALFLDSPVATEKMKKTGEVGYHGKGLASLSWSMSRVWDGLPDKLSSRCSVRMRWESSETFCQQAYKHPNCEVFMWMLVSRLGGLVLRQRWNRCQQRCPVRAFVCKARHSVETR